MSTSVISGDTRRSGQATARPRLLGALAALSAGAAAIHFAVTFEHFQEYLLYGVFFLVIAWAQLIWPLGLFWGPSRLWQTGTPTGTPAGTPAGTSAGAQTGTPAGAQAGAPAGAPRWTERWDRLWLELGVVGNTIILAVYIASRTAGLPFGPDSRSAESAGALDIVCCLLEFALIAGCVALLWRPDLASRPVRPRDGLAGVASVAAVPVLVLAATTAVLTPGWGGPEGPAGMASEMSQISSSSSSSSVAAAGMGDMGSTDGLPDMRMYGSTAAPSAAQVLAAGQLVRQTDATLAKFENVQAAFAAGYTYVLRTNGEEHLLYDGPNPAYAGLNPKDPSSLVYAINVPHHAPVLLGAMYIMGGDSQNGPQVGGSLTRWHSHLTVCRDGRPTIAGFGVQLRGHCDPSTWTDQYTAQMLHVWVVPYPGGVFSDDLSRGATDAAVQAALHRG